MPRQKRDKISLRKSWIQDLEVTRVIKIDGAKIICLACTTGFNFTKKTELEQHLATMKHKNSMKKFDANPQSQLLLSDALQNQPNKSFNKDLCRAMVSAGIPWNKLTNPDLENFLEKYTGKSIPDESTLRKNYLPQLYAESIEQIRRDVGTDSIWMSIDETTDKCGRYIANVIIGTLRKESPTKSHLIKSSRLEKTNNETITQTVLDSLQLLWPGCIQEDIKRKFLLFLTDGVKYMLKSGKTLKGLYPQLLHVTCVAHGMNRVAEEIRSQFPDLDQLVASMKSAFKKAPSRTAIYKTKYPLLPLPPDLVIIRWGTWLKAVEFYAKNFEEVKDIVESLKNDAAAVNKLQTLILSEDLPKDLAFVSVNYTFLADKLTEMQERGASLRQSLQYLDDIEEKIFAVRGQVGKSIISKFKNVIMKNPDLDKLKQISSILERDELDEDIPLGLSPAKIAAFKYAPTTTVEAERSFSMHKFLLSERRRKLTPEHLEMELVIHFGRLNDI